MRERAGTAAPDRPAEREGEHVFERGRYRARLSRAPADIAAAQRLRHRAFFGSAAEGGGRDGDRFDRLCEHVLVEEAASGRPVACYRLLALENGAEIRRSYAAQYYDLERLSAYRGRLVEMGRFCLAPECHDPEILRTAWAMMTRFVDGRGIGMMFGCSSFAGTDPRAHLPGLALLRQRHLAPERWRPGEAAAELFRLAETGAAKPSLRAVPPLLRTYLAMGGWVSDHAVIDRGLGTLHVFTGLEVARVPPARARALRELAYGAGATSGGGRFSKQPQRRRHGTILPVAALWPVSPFVPA